MCGLFGHSRLPGDAEAPFLEALGRLTHRGPDDEGVFVDERVRLGHRRLSIIDLSPRGRQPMVCGETGVVLAANGEVYNHGQLRRDLVAQGARFRSDSDSEVLLHGYVRWGLDRLLQRIEGMYAFVIHDPRSAQLHLVRDRVGIKPLYYGHIDGRWVWASELKAIEQFAGPHLSIDVTAAYDYLTCLYVPPPKTLYREVRKLPSAHVATLRLDHAEHAPQLRRYWQIESVGDLDCSAPQAAQAVHAAVVESVAEQGVSDVPVAVFLSGGIDSSVVAAAASERAEGLHALSVGFGTARDESLRAAPFAASLGMRCERLTVDLGEVPAVVDQLAALYDEPFGDSSAVPTLLLCREARRACTVALAGDGGDELFGGYTLYQRFAAFEAKRRLPVGWLGAMCMRRGGTLGRIGQRLLRDHCLRGVELYALLRGGLPAALKDPYRRLWEIPPDYDDCWYFRPWYDPSLPVLTRLRWLDFHCYLPEDILTKVDRASMAHGLEVRVPLLSTRLVELAFALPDALHRPSVGATKPLLRAAFHGQLSREILDASKQGFSLPLENWRQRLGLKGMRWHQHLLHRAFAGRMPLPALQALAGAGMRPLHSSG